MPADFSGYASRANVRCSDGRTILPNAFEKNNGMKVPLVWQHGHKDVSNVLGHAVLENRADGVYAYGHFNDTDGAKHARSAVVHGDVDSMSIYANDLQERGGVVTHGHIREVSLVLSGANPEAKIDNVVIHHSDGDVHELDNEVVISFGDSLQHADGDDSNDSSDSSDSSESNDSEDKTVQDVLDTLNEEQLAAVAYMISAADDEDDEDDDEDTNSGGTAEHSNLSGDNMPRNLFENTGGATGGTLTHSQINAARKDLNNYLAQAAKNPDGTLKDVLKHAISNSSELKHAIGEDTDYGINTLELLFPEANLVNGEKPEAIRRSQEWVNNVLSGVSKRPFSRLKMRYFNMTHEEARARGYIRGNLKKEMFWSMTQRTTEPTTVYQKEKIDRDDLIDITTVDIVAWMWQEMRISLNEEVARAIFFGDGREVDDPDKISEDKIRPIAKEDDFYAHKIGLPQTVLDDPLKMVDAIFAMRKAYKGTGSPTLYTSERLVTDLLLLRKRTVDGFEGERYYDSKEALARALNVSNIVEIDDYFFTDKNGDPSDLLGIIVNLSDYAVGTDKGGEITSFDDFDIDYNQYKYLLEGRMSGALIKPKSALVISRTSGAEITQSSPMYETKPTHEPTVPVGATYRSTGPLGGTVKEDPDAVEPEEPEEPEV